MNEKAQAAIEQYALVPERLPRHVAVIMDGNGRWAKQRGNMRVFGHKNAIKAVRDTTEACAELGIDYLTLYAFSTENWQRPKYEIDALMRLLVDTIRKEIKTLQDNDIRLATIGNTDQLPDKTREKLFWAMEETKHNSQLTLTLALSYGARHDMNMAVQRLAAEVKSGELQPEDITQDHIARALSTAHMPDPELLIRTSGEFRVSNFLLWEIAYTEFYITEIFWPDFRREHLYAALKDYQGRERRLGKTSEQLESSAS